MDLTTRCPKCGTVFQASLSDLQLRKGYIRCIQCAHIFDGYAEVVSDAPSAPQTRAMPNQAAGLTRVPPGPVVSVADEPLPEEDAWVPVAHDAAPDPAPAPLPQVFRSGREAAEPHEAPILAEDEPSISWDAPAADAWREPTVSLPPERLEPQVGPGAAAEPFVVDARPGHRSQGGTAAPLMQSDTAPWWLGVARFVGGILLMVLVFVSGLQLLYVYRGQLAQTLPIVRPVLEQACVYLQCRVPYAREASLLAITGSALRADDAAPQAGPAAAQAAAAPEQQRFVLQLTLRNQAAYPQEWPTLVLDLKDSAGTLLVRRNLAPADYLGAQPPQHPFAAHSEVLVRVPLTLTGLHINGYQLDLFYP